MEILAVILAIVAAFVVFKFVKGMVKFAVLGVIVVALYLLMTSGWGA